MGNGKQGEIGGQRGSLKQRGLIQDTWKHGSGEGEDNPLQVTLLLLPINTGE